ncbi:unnamed protein product [Trifolium pratense]|uniref:Uncharacterized protein n=1 Tax=Trifolium pratense TaxID=57577 RepID=A0ACB0IIX2_TRIPR|nr:unnamed protein product [Trifolium pratense]
MASKRTSYDDDDDSTKNLHVPSTKRIKHHDDGNPEQQHPLFPTTMSLLSAFNDKNIIDFYVEPFIRKVTREVLDHRLARSRGLTINRQVNPQIQKLCFMNNLPQRNYTDSKIKAKGGELLRIELRDAENQHIVRGEGSSMKIQICVLHGDFRKEDWTAEEFDKQIVIPREGKGTLLKGDKVITLKDGVAFINNLEFTDIIKGRTKEVRLGAKIVRSNSIGSDIKEGRSEPFRVLNGRGKAYKKHDHPSMNDEVWRLRGMRKDGKLHTELASHGIKCVKDFLQLYKTNEASLREKIGKIAEKSWNTIIAHVKECDVDDDDEEEEEEERVNAYKNLNDLKQMPIDTTTHGLVETSTGVQPAQYGGQDQTLPQLDFSIPLQDLLNTDPTSFNSYQPAFGEMAQNWFGDGNIFYGFDGVSQTGQFESSNSWEQQLNAFVNQPFLFKQSETEEATDGAGPSNHSSSSKVKLKKDWQKIRFALKFMLYMTRKKEQILVIYTP